VPTEPPYTIPDAAPTPTPEPAPVKRKHKKPAPPPAPAIQPPKLFGFGISAEAERVHVLPLLNPSNPFWRLLVCGLETTECFDAVALRWQGADLSKAYGYR